MGVYLLHYDRPFKGNRLHYIGFTDRDPQVRLKEHRSGRSKYTALAVKDGINFDIAYWWPDGTRQFEHWLKHGRRGLSTKHWCPACALGTCPIPTLLDMTAP